MRSHPTFDSIRSDITLFDDGVRTSNETNRGGKVTPPVSEDFISELVESDGTPLLFVEKSTGMFYVSQIARKYSKQKPNKIVKADNFREYVEEVKAQFNLSEEQAIECRLSPDGNNDGYYCHFLVALKFAAIVSRPIELKMYTILARYLIGDVTTAESRTAARFMARSLGVVSRDPAAPAAPETVEIAGFKRRLAMEVHDQAASRDAVIADKVEELKSSERSNDILRDRVAEKDEENAALKAEMARDKPYYRAWKRLYDEKRDLVDKIEEHEVTIRKYEAKFGALE